MRTKKIEPQSRKGRKGGCLSFFPDRVKQSGKRLTPLKGTRLGVSLRTWRLK